MAGAAIASFVADTVSAAVLDTAIWDISYASGLFMGAEISVGTAIAGVTGVVGGAKVVMMEGVDHEHP